MTRQRRTVVVLAVALAAAGASSYGVYRLISKAPIRTVEIATAHAVVAASAMPVGTLLTRESVKLVAWPASTPLANGFSDVDAVVGRSLLEPVVENEPLMDNDLAPKEAGGGLAPSIPPGMRALSVKVNEVIGVAGFAVPGSHVDVLAIVHQRDESTVRIVVSNVRVLTAGTQFDQENAKKEGKAIPSTVVTLLVSPEDAQKVALAQSEGQIMLALRNPLETQRADSRASGQAGLLGPPAPTSPLAPGPAVRGGAKAAPATGAKAAPAAIPAPFAWEQYSVEIFRATKRTEQLVSPR